MRGGGKKKRKRKKCSPLCCWQDVRAPEPSRSTLASSVLSRSQSILWPISVDRIYILFPPLPHALFLYSFFEKTRTYFKRIRLSFARSLSGGSFFFFVWHQQTWNRSGSASCASHRIQSTSNCPCGPPFLKYSRPFCRFCSSTGQVIRFVYTLAGLQQMRIYRVAKCKTLHTAQCCLMSIYAHLIPTLVFYISLLSLLSFFRSFVLSCFRAFFWPRRLHPTFARSPLIQLTRKRSMLPFLFFLFSMSIRLFRSSLSFRVWPSAALMRMFKHGTMYVHAPAKRNIIS